MRQAMAISRVPDRIPVSHVTNNVSSMDHAGVMPCNHDCDPVVDQTTYVWKGFLGFSTFFNPNLIV